MIFAKYYLLFFIYSFIGWVIEVVDTKIETKQLVNRGFMMGPYCPIHGVGATLSILLLSGLKDDPIIVFVLGLCLCTVLEFLTSLVMEKLFNARWWDYSNCKYNLDGRVKLTNSIYFGILIFLLVCVINPIIQPKLFGLNNKLLLVLFSFIFLIMLTDFIISTIIISKNKKTFKSKHIDDTPMITKKVRETIRHIKNK